ncbi:MAG: DUF5615 family PIN-like protein [Anaerolinea sp.]|nr:DUF5615 family PIN-like protein [Anaerolinea sp.]
MGKPRFYIDENIEPELETQLRRYGIEAVSARSLEKLGDTDPNHLQRATEMGYILCTQDQDFLRMHAEGAIHCGLIFASAYGAHIGGWVRQLRRLYEQETAESLSGIVTYISAK